jgi:lysocardiolipin and lysophospholipid acyltransferase
MSLIETAMDYLSVLKQRCRGVSFVMVLTLTAFLGFVVFSPLFITVFVLRLSSARWIIDTVISTWFALAVASFELLYGVKVVVNGDVSNIDKYCSSLIIMNHRTRLDWLFYFAVQARYSTLRRFKISLKDELRHAPGAGWAMQAKQFLFLKRNWDLDKIRIETSLKHFQCVNYYPQLLFFPEGTDFTPYTRNKSKQYAKKNDLPEYEYVLHPRTTGFTSVFGYMKLYNNLKQVIDVTIAYPQNILQNESDLLNGNIPREIVFTVKTYKASELPDTSDNDLVIWLEGRWREKENFLKTFYEHKQQTDDNNYDFNQNLDIERDLILYSIGAILFWAFVTIVTVWCLLFYTYFRWTFLSLSVINLIISTCTGFDSLFTSLSVM